MEPRKRRFSCSRTSRRRCVSPLEGAMPAAGSYEGHLRVSRQGSDAELARCRTCTWSATTSPRMPLPSVSSVYRGVVDVHTHLWVLGKIR